MLSNESFLKFVFTIDGKTVASFCAGCVLSFLINEYSL